MIVWLGLVLLAPVTLFAQDKFTDALDKSVTLIKPNLENNSIYSSRNQSNTLVWQNQANAFSGTALFIIDVVDKFVFPLLIAASILTIIIGLYDLMISEKEDIEKGTKYIIFGVLGIVIIQSAKFITSTYISIITKVVPYDNTNQTINFAQSAYEIYNQLIMPFINVFMYAVIGTLFVILLVHVMRFITSSEEDVATKAKSIMISNVVGIIVILLAKTMVEIIYGKQETVIRSSAATNLWDIGTWVLAGADFTVVFSIINYALGFLWFIILIIIIIQTYQLLVNPTSDELIKKTKTNLLYIVIGLGIIALAYVIVNFIIVQ
jgi:hypothetical protein